MFAVIIDVLMYVELVPSFVVLLVVLCLYVHLWSRTWVFGLKMRRVKTSLMYP